VANKLPDYIRETLLRVGEVEWFGIEPSTPEQLGTLFQEMIENTYTNHDLEGPQMCHYVAAGNLSIAMVGTSPNSGVISSIITAAWNNMVARAKMETLESA